METMSSQVLALVVGLLKAARSDATFRKVLDESPRLTDSPRGQPGLPLPQPQTRRDMPSGPAQVGALSLTPRQCGILRLIAVGRREFR